MYQSTSDHSESTICNNVSSLEQHFNFNMDVNYQNITLLDENDRDDIYRKQILDFFKISEYKQTVIDIKMDLLKPIIEKNEKLKSLSIKFANMMLQDKYDIGIVMFFSFDYFHDTFILLKELILEKKINDNVYNNLIKKL